MPYDKDATAKRRANLAKREGEKPPTFFVDYNHSNKAMGVASIHRKHDLEFVCTVEPTSDGESIIICDVRI